MRTTIDLPADLHALARQLAHDGNITMSEAVVELMRQGLGPRGSTPRSSRRGMPLMSVGHPVTVEDVRSLEDE